MFFEKVESVIKIDLRIKYKHGINTFTLEVR